MTEPYPIPPESLDEWNQWVAERPPAIQDAVKTYPMTTCYRDETGRGHYRLYSYDEKIDGGVSVTLTHGRDSFLPGVRVFGIDPKSLTRCDCGKWDWPTAEQCDATGEKIDKIARAAQHKRN